jgi:hypothetical protein
MKEYPEYGTAPIKCGKRKCKWTGTELELKSTPHPTQNNVHQKVCPLCGNDSYLFTKTKEIK